MIVYMTHHTTSCLSNLMIISARQMNELRKPSEFIYIYQKQKLTSEAIYYKTKHHVAYPKR